MNDFEHEEEAPESIEASSDMRTYVFSATMSKELQKNLKKPAGKRRIVNPEDRGELGALGAYWSALLSLTKSLTCTAFFNTSSEGSLMETLDFRDPDPEVIDLLPEGGKVSSLLEAGIDCLASDKDLHLYHFLLRYPGKSIVFLASIDGIRRLHPLLSLLDLGQVIMLHSGMQQKARLKALDRFKSAEKAVLLATDVAARGLDVPEVDHVVHYQLPRTADTYVHRSGRTARAGREGVSLQLVSPEEKTLQKMIFHSLHRGKDETLAPVFGGRVLWLNKQVFSTSCAFCRGQGAVKLARGVDHHGSVEAAHRIGQAHRVSPPQSHKAEPRGPLVERSCRGYGRRPGRALVRRQATTVRFVYATRSLSHQLLLLLLFRSDDDRKRLKKSKSTETHYLKNQLAEELKRPLVVKGISSKYITSGLQPGFADAMVNNTSGLRCEVEREIWVDVFADALWASADHSNIVGMRQGQAKLDAKSKQ